MARANEVGHGNLLGKVCRLLVDCPNASDYAGKWNDKGPVMIPHPLKAGDTVKVVMVSRFGDCGITPNLKAQFGYIARVEPEQLEVIEGAAHDKDRDI